MKKINNWDKVEAATDRPVLPAGAYPIMIKAAEEKHFQGNNGAFSRLEVSFDIADGEYKNFFADEYRSQTWDDKKWKGVFRLYVPKEDGTKEDEWTKKKFKAFTNAIEDSNAGYHWNWDESTLKGQCAVCIFRNEEWDYNGRTGWKAQPFIFISTKTYEEGKYKIPDDKPLEGKVETIEKDFSDFEEVDEIDDSDLPF